MTKKQKIISINITGDFMEEKYINFLKKYNLYREDIFEFIKDKTVFVDYKDPNSLGFIGVYPNLVNGIIKDIKMVVPKIEDDTSISMNIHEYIHLLKIFDYLNKEYVFSDYEELLPVMYELVYAKENNNKELLKTYKEHIQEDDNYLKILLELFDFGEDEKTLKINK